MKLGYLDFTSETHGGDAQQPQKASIKEVLSWEAT